MQSYNTLKGTFLNAKNRHIPDIQSPIKNKIIRLAIFPLIYTFKDHNLSRDQRL